MSPSSYCRLISPLPACVNPPGQQCSGGGFTDPNTLGLIRTNLQMGNRLRNEGGCVEHPCLHPNTDPNSHFYKGTFVRIPLMSQGSNALPPPLKRQRLKRQRRSPPAIMLSVVEMRSSTCWISPTSVHACRLRTLFLRMAVKMLQTSA